MKKATRTTLGKYINDVYNAKTIKKVTHKKARAEGKKACTA